MLKNILGMAVAAVIFLSGVSSVYSQAEDQTNVVKMAEVSEAAKKTIREEVGKGRLGKIEKVNEDGIIVYNVEMRKGGRPRSFSVNDTGDLLDMEVFIGETPIPVREAIKKRQASGELDGITKVFEEGNVSYEADITRDGKTRTFTFDEKGELTEMEIFLTEAPMPVQQAVQRVQGVRKLGDITEVFEDGETNYEVEINPDEKGPVMTFNAKGDVLIVEQATSQSKLPEPVKKTLNDLLKGDRLVSLTKSTEDGEVTYNADIRRADKWETISIGADGKVAE